MELQNLFKTNNQLQGEIKNTFGFVMKIYIQNCYLRPPGFKEVITDDDGFETEIIEFRNAVSRLKSKLYKGSFQKRFSGFCPLRGGGGTPPFR